jgi:hypothetical protein
MPVSCSEPESSQSSLGTPRTRHRVKGFSSSALASHQIGENAKNAVGPVLNGLFGRKTGEGGDCPCRKQAREGAVAAQSVKPGLSPFGDRLTRVFYNRWLF